MEEETIQNHQVDHTLLGLVVAVVEEDSKVKVSVVEEDLEIETEEVEVVVIEIVEDNLLVNQKILGHLVVGSEIGTEEEREIVETDAIVIVGIEIGIVVAEIVAEIVETEDGDHLIVIGIEVLGGHIIKTINPHQNQHIQNLCSHTWKKPVMQKCCFIYRYDDM